VYCLRVYRRSRWTGRFRIARGYIGQTRYRDYRKRIDQHLYGYWYNGEWNPPKYWAHEVVDYYPLWQSDRWCDWGLDTREFLCIRVLFPLHNVLLNLGNPRRIIPPPVDQRVYPTPDQITAVERYPGKPRRPVIPQQPADMQRTSRVADYSGPGAIRRAVLAVSLLRWVLLAAVLVLFIPGLPGWDAAAGGIGWGVDHRDQLGALLVLGAGAWFVTTLKPRRRRRSGSTRARRRSTRKAPFL
jgi:hypothetical protein